ncbi:restriction endonuclease subunit S [Parabacteroides distasonis]|uniref:restriction endonuclease subunit S n=1 Tax=Parabacteroides distasonis TaxID=823 RepID=UPI0022DF9246|nr:restriction endonuclease subunit S [Parabacteroides distasonis]
MPFEVPDNWVWCKLKDCCHIVGRIGFRGYTKDDLVPEKQGAITLSPSNIVENIMNYDKCTYISWAKFEESPEIKVIDGDILLVKTGSSFGKCALVSNLPQKATINPQFVVLKYIQIEKQYLTWVLQSGYARICYENFVLGTAIPTFTQAVLGDMLIPLPSINEQQRIIAEIKHWFALIDKIEQSQSDLQTIIKHTKSKILDLAIHGKLVLQNPNDEPASELLKRINPEAEITCDNGHYPQLPDGWCKCRLEDIVEYEQPQAYIVNSTDYDDRYLTPVLTAGKSFVIGYTNETEGIYQNTPCIIFDDFTTDSKLVDFPFKVKSSAMKILKVADDIEIEYVAMFMNITRLIGDTHKRYWISEYSKLCIPIPPKEEQKRIINAANAMFEKLDAIMESL